jgi:hypothetical protein
MMRKIAVLVTGSALALSFPVASSVALPNGQPSDGNGNSKACDNLVAKSKGKGPKKSKSDLPSQAREKGWKCGFKKTGLTAVS